MERMKSLVDKLREAVKQSAITESDKAPAHKEVPERTKKNDISKTGKEVKKNNKATKIQEGSSDDIDITQRINKLCFNGERKEPKQVPIRFPATLYSKLRLLGEEASIQKITVYAVNQLIESEEIKAKLKTILKNLNE